MPLTNKDLGDYRIPERSCTRCGNPGHNSRTCDGRGRVVDKIGVEVEGLWRDLEMMRQHAVEVTGTRGVSDGSLREEEYDGRYYESWEFRTDPGSLASTLRQVYEVYPDATNDSVGMHVHLSFMGAGDVTLLSSPEFEAFHYQKWNEWGEAMGIPPSHNFWKRLRGENNYCRREAITVDSVHRVDHAASRYRQINFQSYGQHRTVEFRLLPCFRDAHLALKAITHLVKFVTEWLLARPARFHPATVVLGNTSATSTTEWVTVLSGTPDVAEEVVTQTETVEVDLPRLPELEPGHLRLAARDASSLIENIRCIEEYRAQRYYSDAEYYWDAMERLIGTDRANAIVTRQQVVTP